MRKSENNVLYIFNMKYYYIYRTVEQYHEIRFIQISIQRKLSALANSVLLICCSTFLHMRNRGPESDHR